uniref:LIM zinc-binding domain-containing protein n=1 Tax=Timema shepardi TaxID=629360 RepID=A0A7R9FY54_TIMSH|nr:unnamed protein product [Timema shepardi]
MEYTMAEEHAFHVKHFCCFECDVPLGGKKYVVKHDQPICLNCCAKKYRKLLDLHLYHNGRRCHYMFINRCLPHFLELWFETLEVMLSPPPPTPFSPFEVPWSWCSFCMHLSGGAHAGCNRASRAGTCVCLKTLILDIKRKEVVAVGQLDLGLVSVVGECYTCGKQIGVEDQRVSFSHFDWHACSKEKSAVSCQSAPKNPWGYYSCKYFLEEAGDPEFNAFLNKYTNMKIPDE